VGVFFGSRGRRGAEEGEGAEEGKRRRMGVKDAGSSWWMARRKDVAHDTERGRC
jgi:hypothetical protein